MAKTHFCYGWRLLSTLILSYSNETYFDISAAPETLFRASVGLMLDYHRRRLEMVSYNIQNKTVRDCKHPMKLIIVIRIWGRILVQVTIYRRLLIGRDGHLDQSEAYDIS